MYSCTITSVHFVLFVLLYCKLVHQCTQCSHSQSSHMTSWILNLQTNSRKEGRKTDRLSPGGACFALPKNINRRRKICTDLFRKVTANPTALLLSSAHHGHIIHNIVNSMALRLLRICSSEENFENRLKELKSDFLVPRIYHPKGKFG